MTNIHTGFHQIKESAERKQRRSASQVNSENVSAENFEFIKGQTAAFARRGLNVWLHFNFNHTHLHKSGLYDL